MICPECHRCSQRPERLEQKWCTYCNKPDYLIRNPLNISEYFVAIASSALTSNTVDALSGPIVDGPASHVPDGTVLLVRNVILKMPDGRSLLLVHRCAVGDPLRKCTRKQLLKPANIFSTDVLAVDIPADCFDRLFRDSGGDG